MNSRTRISAAFKLCVFGLFALLTSLSCQDPTSINFDNAQDYTNNPDFEAIAPKGFSVTLSDLVVELSWETDSTAPVQYVIRRKVGEGAFTQLVTLNSTATSYSDTLAERGTLPITYEIVSNWTVEGTTKSASASLTITFDYALDVVTEGSGRVEERLIQAKSTDYEYGSVVELTAIPDEEWLFIEWIGVDESTGSVAQVTLTEDKTVTAVFRKSSVPLTVDVVGQGTVAEQVVKAKTTDYPYETIVELTAEPASGWTFTGWSGDATGAENPLQVTVDGPKTVTATFVRINYPLTVEVIGQGAVAERVVEGFAKTTEYAFETVVELTANPEAGWSFTGWDGDVTGTGNPVQLTMDGPKSVSATFKEQFDLSITVNGRGGVTADPPPTVDGQYLDGDRVTLTAVPEDGWMFEGWSGDLAGNQNPIEIELDSDKVITATFTTSPVTDISGNVYKTVPIGDQIWMAQNLRVSQYRDGSDIESPEDALSWSRLSVGGWSYYDNDLVNSVDYGKLYNWFAVTDPRGLCPSGWHVPNSLEWNAMVAALGGSSVAGGKMKSVGSDYWNAPNTGATNESGMGVNAAGTRSSGGSFLNKGDVAEFWSSTSLSAGDAWFRRILTESAGIGRSAGDKRNGASVRCIRD